MQFPAEFPDEIDAQCVRGRNADGDLLAVSQGKSLFSRLVRVSVFNTSRRFRAGQNQNAEPLGDLLQTDGAVARRELAQVVVVVRLIGAGRDEIEATRCPFIDGEFGAHAAMLRQHVAERDAAALLRDRIGEDRFQPGAGAGAGDFHLGEGRHVEQADAGVTAFTSLPTCSKLVGSTEGPFLDDRPSSSGGAWLWLVRTSTPTPS